MKGRRKGGTGTGEATAGLGEGVVAAGGPRNERDSGGRVHRTRRREEELSGKSSVSVLNS